MLLKLEISRVNLWELQVLGTAQTCWQYLSSVVLEGLMTDQYGKTVCTNFRR